MSEEITIGKAVEELEETRNCIMIGNGARASGVGAIAFGAYSGAHGDGAMALGHCAEAIGKGAIAVGDGVRAIGVGAVQVSPEFSKKHLEELRAMIRNACSLV